MGDFADLLGEGLSLVGLAGGIFLLFLAIGCIALGVFLTYFGNRSKRGFGAGQLALGVVLMITVTWFLGVLPFEPPFNLSRGALVVGFVSGLSMILGFAAAMGMFLLVMIRRN